MTEIFSAVVKFFEESDKWDFVRDDLDSVLHTAHEGKNGDWKCYAKAREKQKQLIFYSIAPVKVPAFVRTAIALLLTRVNYGLVLGNFEFDLSDGEIRFKTSIDVQGCELSTALVKRVVLTNLAMMDKYIPSIKNVISGTSPEEAIARIER
jgi:hypothetical protein